MGLVEFQQALTPTYLGKPTEAPLHLAPFLEAFEAAEEGQEVQLVAGCPPRHGKTETVLHFLAWVLIRNPGKRVMYCTYSDKLAKKGSRAVRRLFLQAGGVLSPGAKRADLWETAQGGQFLACGIQSGLTGFGADIIVVDDAVADRAAAESEAVRQSTWEWFESVALTRLEPGGSCFVIGTPWHHEDLGRTLMAKGWKSVHLPALDHEDRALWASRFSADRLKRIRAIKTAYEWSALYMCQPVPKGGAVFKEPASYDPEKLPDRLRRVVGSDFAYTAKARSDWSVGVALGESGGFYYVLDLIRHQVEAPKFSEQLKPFCQAQGTMIAHAYIGAVEKGIVDFHRNLSGVSINAKVARAGKFERSQPLAAAWNAGRVLVPVPSANCSEETRRRYQWVATLVQELCAFTGLGDRHDDQVDALVSAYDALSVRPVPRGVLTQQFLPFG
jgi:predicted phage terminase large subunit-like protein